MFLGSAVSDMPHRASLLFRSGLRYSYLKGGFLIAHELGQNVRWLLSGIKVDSHLDYPSSSSTGVKHDETV